MALHSANLTISFDVAKYVNKGIERVAEISGAKIRELRLKKGCTQIQLTVKIIELGGKMDATNISRMESGRTNITLYQLHRISEALEIPMKDFLDFELPKE